MSRATFRRVAALAAGALVLAAATVLPSDAATPSSRASQPSAARHSTQDRVQDRSVERHAAKKHAVKKKHKKRKHKRKHRAKHTNVKPAAPKPATPAPATPAPATPVPATTAPTNAAKIFKWGNAQINDEFHGAMASTWAVNQAGAGLVRNQNGMLTLNTTTTSGTVTADWLAGARQYGRWEARVRTRQYGTSATPYRAVWELVPTSGDQCSRSIILSDSTIGQNPATMHLRNTTADFSATKVLDLRQDVFHTYAVEVTPDHISWFIDTVVVMTEPRSAARTGAAYTVRFRMVAPPGARMNQGRMQMDWVRHYTLERKNAQSLVAPQASQGTYSGRC